MTRITDLFRISALQILGSGSIPEHNKRFRYAPYFGALLAVANPSVALGQNASENPPSVRLIGFNSLLGTDSNSGFTIAGVRQHIPQNAGSSGNERNVRIDAGAQLGRFSSGFFLNTGSNVNGTEASVWIRGASQNDAIPYTDTRISDRNLEFSLHLTHELSNYFSIGMNLEGMKRYTDGTLVTSGRQSIAVNYPDFVNFGNGIRVPETAIRTATLNGLRSTIATLSLQQEQFVLEPYVQYNAPALTLADDVYLAASVRIGASFRMLAYDSHITGSETTTVSGLVGLPPPVRQQVQAHVGSGSHSFSRSISQNELQVVPHVVLGVSLKGQNWGLGGFVEVEQPVAPVTKANMSAGVNFYLQTGNWDFFGVGEISDAQTGIRSNTQLFGSLGFAPPRDANLSGNAIAGVRRQLDRGLSVAGIVQARRDYTGTTLTPAICLGYEITHQISLGVCGGSEYYRPPGADVVLGYMGSFGFRIGN